MTDNNKRQNKDMENPYLNSRKDWNEMLGKEKTNASMWKLIALLNMLITLVAVCGMIYAAQLPDVVPFIFKEDGSGGLTALGIPNGSIKIDDRVVANQLLTFVEDLRQVPDSNEIRSLYVHRVKMMSTQDLFRNKLSPMYKDAYQNSGGATISTKISSVFPIDKKTWEIDFAEFRGATQTGQYKALIHYVKQSIPTKDPTELMYNPLGILVDDVQINPVIGR